MKEGNMSRHAWRSLGILIAAILILVGVVVAAVFLIPQSNAVAPIPTSTESPIHVAEAQPVPTNTKSDAPTMSLEGSWTFKNEKGGVFNATITDNSIKVVMEAPDGTTMLYWNGTFDAKQPSGSTITSDVFETKAVLSQSKTKNFTVGSDTLSFDFTMKGTTKKIDLRRV